MATLVARYCQKKLRSSNLCRDMECKEPTKIFTYGSKKQKKSVTMATLVARYFRKSNQLQYMQGFGMQRTHKKMFKPKKHEKVLISTNKSQFEKHYRKSIAMATAVTKKLAKKHHHYSCSSPCKKHILKILVDIFAWVLFIKIPPI